MSFRNNPGFGSYTAVGGDPSGGSPSRSFPLDVAPVGGGLRAQQTLAGAFVFVQILAAPSAGCYRLHLIGADGSTPGFYLKDGGGNICHATAGNPVPLGGILTEGAVSVAADAAGATNAVYLVYDVLFVVPYIS
jgi:hypothetical protein